MMNNDLVRRLLDLERIPRDSEVVRLAWERPIPPWLWLLLLAAALVFAAWSYRRIAGPRPARAVLGAVRFLLIALLLLVLSGPMLEHPEESVEQDWVLVLADRSRSLGIADAGDDAGRISREAQLRTAIEANAALWNDLSRQRRVVWLGFNDGAFNLDVDPVAGLPDLGATSGDGTSLDAALEQALGQAAARPLSGVIVLSDGRTTDPPRRGLVRRLQAEAVPVFTVPLGSSDPVGDVAIRRVEAPQRAYVRDQVPVLVELDQLGAAALDGATVRLVDRLSGAVLDEITLDGGDPAPQVTLTAEPELAGEATWEVVLETARADLVPENNRRPIDLELVDRPLRVLYVEGYPRWEYRYLKNLMIREETIDSSVMLLSADRDFAQEGNQPITRLPRTPEEFSRYDVVVIGDVPGSFFAPEQLEVMRRQIADRGTGLLWIGGDRSMPRTYSGTVLADLLPMRSPLSLSPIGRSVNMRPTELAVRLGVLQLGGVSADGWPEMLADPQTGWSQLRWAQHIEPDRLKPTAEVLAETAEPVDGEALPLIVHMRYGAGQSIYVATDEIWRWRYGQGERLPEQFWIQMIRMLGRDSLISAGRPATLEATPRRGPVNQAVHVVLRLHDARLASARRSSVNAAVLGPDGRPVAEIELRRESGDAERYSATFTPRTTGALRIVPDDPSLEGLDVEAIVEIFAPEDELRRPETDHPLLAELAESTGGAVLPPDRLGEVAGLLKDRSVRTINAIAERIWDTPLVLALIILLLTIEWLGRKAVRLA